MKKELFISAASLITLAACSDSDTTAGGSIEDQNASLEDWFNYGSNWKESAYTKIDGGKIALTEGKETGARAECTADSTTYTMTIQIENGILITTQQATGLSDSCDSIYTSYKTSCMSSPHSEFLVQNALISNGCKDGAFKAACVVEEIEDDAINGYISDFNNTAANRCSAISKIARSFTGYFEIPSSSSTAGESSSSVYDPDTFSLITVNPVDTAINIDSTQTLENYVLQFAASLEELSFDNHVIAYSGLTGMNCMDYATRITGISTTNLIPNSPVIQIERDSIFQCFPMTAKLLKEQNSNEKESCRYFMTFTSDGNQPTGHVLSSIANGELEFTSVKRSGLCAVTNMFFSVFFLIEDCDNEIESTEFQTTHKTFTSEIWNCEEEKSNSSVSAYGEWIKL